MTMRLRLPDGRQYVALERDDTLETVLCTTKQWASQNDIGEKRYLVQGAGCGAPSYLSPLDITLLFEEKAELRTGEQWG